MGLSATQARFLGITARKVNVQYEGQQAYQARTALANESANLYRELYRLQVPTPPSVMDYYKTEYSYNYGGNSYTISEYSESTDFPGKYRMTTTSTQTVSVPYKGYVSNGTIRANGGGTYDISYNGMTATVSATMITADDIMEKYSTASNQFYYYTNTSSNIQYLIEQNTFNNYIAGGDYEGEINQFYYSNESQKLTNTYDNCTINFDTSGNITNIINPAQAETSLNVSSSSVIDEAGYNAAMAEYDNQKNHYENEIERINAKTEDIQVQDRSLEMRLKQLDTEEEALKTELDTLKSILDDSIEKVFKTFSG